jgi:hypothetical protein
VLRELAICLFLTGQMSLEAYRQRLRDGRSIFAPTLKVRSRVLRRPDSKAEHCLGPFASHTVR